jgi:hypothetical protein
VLAKSKRNEKKGPGICLGTRGAGHRIEIKMK